MNKESVISYFKNHEEGGWIGVVARHVGSDRVRLLSQDAGSYVAQELLADYKIRRETMKRTGVTFWGVDELMGVLGGMDPEAVVHNYIFEGEGMASIVYFDEADSILIGATTIVV